MYICTVIDQATKFVTIIDNKVIGISRHKDYSLFHFKANDVKALKVPISKFIFVDTKFEVDEVILSAQLKDRGVNYKTAKREAAELTDAELAEVRGAVELARTAMVSGARRKGEADAKPLVVDTPADSPPKGIIAAEAAATGLGELLAHAESSQSANSSDHGQIKGAPEASADAAVEGAGDAKARAEGKVDAVVQGEITPDEGKDDGGSTDANPPVDDPLATLKPPRKKRRR